jgi:hypothetical protein
LLGEIYPRSRPPFDPFPVVTQVLKGYCPVAIHLDQLWGRTWSGRLDSGLTDPAGALYHEIVAEYRMRLAWGLESWSSRWDQATFKAHLHNYFSQWADRKGTNSTTRQRLWEDFSRLLERQHREGELELIRGARLFAEVDFVNPRCRFDLGDSTYHYPIRGRIDELDLSRGLIIERTLERDPLSNRPPLYKDFQAWLCAWSLKALDEHLRPSAFEKLWTSPLKVRLETPDADYEVPFDDARFLPWVAQAYYWIQAVYRNRGQPATSAYQAAACTIDHPDDACMHCRIDCFTRRPAFPRKSQEIARICSQHARALLYDRVWDEDLWYYRQALLPEEYHLEEGSRIKLPILEVKDNSLRVELKERDDRVRENQTFLAVASCLGNMSLGKRLRLTVTHVDKRNNVTLHAMGSSLPAVEPGDLLELIVDAPESTVLLFREPLGHLKDHQRSRLAKLRRVGTDSLLRAQQSGVTNTLRAIAREELFESL